MNNKSDDWVVIKNFGKKAHLLTQGYNGLLIHCVASYNDVVYDDCENIMDPKLFIDSGDTSKCKKCLKEETRRKRIEAVK